MKRFFFLPLFLLVSFPSYAQQVALERDPGYVDFLAIDRWFTVEPTVEVNVKGALLGLVAEASRSEDPELANLLNRLRAVQVRVYKLTADQQRNASTRTAELARSLQSRGWETVVRVRDEGQRVDMFLKSTGNRIDGLTVMVLDPDEGESVFVNIVGEIRPEQIGRLSRKFNIKGID